MLGYAPGFKSRLSYEEVSKQLEDKNLNSEILDQKLACTVRESRFGCLAHGRMSGVGYAPSRETARE